MFDCKISNFPSELVKETSEGITFKCKVQPNASKEAFCGAYGDTVKITLSAPPIEGKANKALVNFLSKKFKVSKACVKILSGETSRIKTVAIKLQHERK